MNEIINCFESGKIYLQNHYIEVEKLQWNEHSSFKGVFLKHLIKGESTGGKFSCHLVKINPQCEIGDHIHEGKWELHEIINGNGKCIIFNKEINYEKGIILTIPENIKHKVIASNNGLYLFAKFIPALI